MYLLAPYQQVICIIWEYFPNLPKAFRESMFRLI